MRRIVSGLIQNLNGIVLIAGAACLTAGVGMICFPAGLIAGGGLAMAGAVLSIWGEEEEKK